MFPFSVFHLRKLFSKIFSKKFVFQTRFCPGFLFPQAFPFLFLQKFFADISLPSTQSILSCHKRGCRTSKYFLLGGSPALCPNGIEIGHVFDAILYKRSSFPGIPFGMPYFRLFCFQPLKSMLSLMKKDDSPFFRSESCNEAY